MEVVRRTTSLGDRLPRGAVRLGLLCLFIVLVGMIPARIPHDAAGWVLLVAGLGVAGGAAAFFVATRRIASHLPLMAGSLRAVDAVLVVIRRTGLPLLALAFFLVWTFVYLGLWWFREESFVGIGGDANPRFSDFFYYATMTALTSPPEGIAPLSRGARSATMIEILTGLALLTTYVSSLLEWRRQERRDAADTPPPGDGA